MQASEFKEIFLPLSRRIFWTAWRLTGNTQEAEDLTQEVFLRLWTKRDALGDISNPEAYCAVLVKNLYFNKTRKRQVNIIDMPLEQPLADDRMLDDVIAKKQSCEQVLRLIEQLPEQQRKVVMMHDVEDKSNDEIRQQTGLTATHIRVLLSRGRKAIRATFKN